MLGSEKLRDDHLLHGAIAFFQGLRQEKEHSFEGEQFMEHQASSWPWPTNDCPLEKGPQIVKQNCHSYQKPAQVNPARLRR